MPRTLLESRKKDEYVFLILEVEWRWIRTPIVKR